MSSIPKNYYELFGIPRSSSIDDIKLAFRQALRDLHPDRIDAKIKQYPDDPELARMLSKLKGEVKVYNEAYNILSDPDKRRLYDQQNFPIITFERNQFDFGEIPRGEKKTLTCKIENSGTPLTSPVSFTLSPEVAGIVVRVLTPDGTQYVPLGQHVRCQLPLNIEVTIDTNIVDTGKILILKSSVDDRSHVLPITFVVSNPPKLAFNVASLDLGQMYANEKTGRSITLTNSGGPAFDLYANWKSGRQRPVVLSGNFPMTLNLEFHTNNFLPGKHTDIFFVKSEDSFATVQVFVEVIPR